MKHEQVVGTRLPKDMVRELERIERVEQIDRSATVRRLLARAIHQWKLEHFAHEYGKGRLGLARAAREAGVSLWELQAYTRQNKIAAQYDLEELVHDLKTIDARRSRKVRR